MVVLIKPDIFVLIFLAKGRQFQLISNPTRIRYVKGNQPHRVYLKLNFRALFICRVGRAGVRTFQMQIQEVLCDTVLSSIS